MSIALDPRTEERIMKLVDTGRFPDANSVVDEALEALEYREQARFLKTRELLLAARNSGDGVLLTPEVWAEIEREADEADRLGLPISDEIRQ